MDLPKTSFAGMGAFCHVMWNMTCRRALLPSGNTSKPLVIPVVDPCPPGGARSLIDVVYVQVPMNAPGCGSHGPGPRHKHSFALQV